MPRKPLTQVDIKRFRDSFCDAAYKLYVQQSYEAVTMRGVAKALGCSPMAAYRYFENKEDVFASLRAMRFQDLAKALESVPSASSPLKYLRALGSAYADFAHKAPHAYRLLYMTPVDPLKIFPEVIKAQEQTRKVLFNATQQVVDSGDIEGDPMLLAHTLWASIHGLVSLDLDNQLTQGASFDELFPVMMNGVIAGG